MAMLTNSEVVEYVGLPEDIIDSIKTQQGQEFQATANQFLNALVNKIVYQTVDSFGWENPFKKFDSFQVNYGDTIENIYVETPKGYTYDKEATDPFTKSINNVKALYANINYEMQYQATIYDSLLRRACLNQYGFMNIINSILASLTTAKNVDEYFAQLVVLNNPELYGNSTGTAGSKEFAELELTGSDAEKAKTLTSTIVDCVTGMQLPNTKYNALGVLTASSLDNLLLIIRKDLYNSINLDYLTGVFNLSKVDLIKKIMVVDSFQVYYTVTEDNQLVPSETPYGEDILFTIIDTKAFDNHVALEDGGLIYNPKAKYTNHFLNLWKIMSFKYFYNAVAYVLKDSD